MKMKGKNIPGRENCKFKDSEGGLSSLESQGSRNTSHEVRV